MLLDPAAERPATLAAGACVGSGQAMPATASASGQAGARAAALARLEAAAQQELRQLSAASTPAGVPADPMLCGLCWDLGLDGVRARMAMRVGAWAPTPA